jgi:hypothetical protein
MSYHILTVNSGHAQIIDHEDAVTDNVEQALTDNIETAKTEDVSKW